MKLIDFLMIYNFRHAHSCGNNGCVHDTDTIKICEIYGDDQFEIEIGVSDWGDKDKEVYLKKYIRKEILNMKIESICMNESFKTLVVCIE